MDKNKSSMLPGSGLGSAGRKPDGELGQALLTILGIGIAGGIALVGGAVKLGEKLLDLQYKAYDKVEAEREARRQAVRAIMEAENEMAAESEEE